MELNQKLKIDGCITKEICISGRKLSEIERILGFHRNRLEKGMVVLALTRKPKADEFNFGGYTQVAGHRYEENYGGVELDVLKAKENIIRNVFKTHGPNRLIKVLPNIRHDIAMSDDHQYPPGLGVPQWKLEDPIEMKVVGIVKGYPDARYYRR